MQIVYHGYINSTGYGTCAQDYILAMLQCDPSIDIKMTPVNRRINGISVSRKAIFDTLINKLVSAEHINIQHCIPPAYKPLQPTIGVAIYETIDPPTKWLQAMNRTEGIITASHFNQNVFLQSGLKKPCYVVPHCFDINLFNETARHDGRYNRFTFLSMGTFRERKNYNTLVNGFYDAFSTRDNVCLLIKTDKSKQLEQMITSIKSENWRSKDTAPIYVDDAILDFEQIPGYMKKADVVVSASHGEGFNLVGLHAAALGIPFITTRFGGTLEYAKPEFCTYFVPHRYSKKNMDGYPQFNGKIWPDLKVSEISEKLKAVYTSYDAAIAKAKLAQRYVHDHFNYTVVGNKMLTAIQEVSSASHSLAV